MDVSYPALSAASVHARDVDGRWPLTLHTPRAKARGEGYYRDGAVGRADPLRGQEKHPWSYLLILP
ncbi:hypothetical protein DAETH_48810 (plasmid) [Deinococcus aetherius]|uniref:Uncharacterized protein n=1 Tax=Deinococcus aetherius TaxID=200252 RepID=A0ABM8AM43_9DEIO|nr:hypothetical protein DAETH_48810 [Deinococcus aetherius]